MPVDTKHPEYELFASDWKRCRDAVAGERVVKAAGEAYLPKLAGQNDKDYKAYLNRALYYEASGKTISGLTGMIFRKPPVREDGGMTDFVEDVTTDGMNLDDFAKGLVSDVLTTARAGILIDYTKLDTPPRTKAEAVAAGARSFFRHYLAESIIYWSENQIRLAEKYKLEKQDDEFEHKQGDQIRVLEVVEGRYQQRIFRKKKNIVTGKMEWEQVELIIPLARGKSLNFIPFVFVGVEGYQGEVEVPPLLGLANVNLSHYRNSADLEHGAHYTGLPQPWVSGINEVDDQGNKQTLKIGSSSAWAFKNPDAKAQYLEFEGKGLDTLVDMMKAKEEKMAALGAQMLTPSARRNEAAETAEIRHMGENSILASLSQTISKALNAALEIAGLWEGKTPATIELNTDFMAKSMTPQMLTALVNTWQSGGISDQTLFDNLKKGEIIDSEKTFEDEQDEIETSSLLTPTEPV